MNIKRERLRKRLSGQLIWAFNDGYTAPLELTGYELSPRLKEVNAHWLKKMGLKHAATSLYDKK